MALEFVYAYCYCCRFEQFHSFVIAAIHSRRLRVKPSIHADWGGAAWGGGAAAEAQRFCILYSNGRPWMSWETTKNETTTAATDPPMLMMMMMMMIMMMMMMRMMMIMIWGAPFQPPWSACEIAFAL